MLNFVIAIFGLLVAEGFKSLGNYLNGGRGSSFPRRSGSGGNKPKLYMKTPVDGDDELFFTQKSGSADFDEAFRL